MKRFVFVYLPKDTKKVLITHSMGGAIASLHVEQYPHDFDEVVLSSPVHQPEILLSSI